MKRFVGGALLVVVVFAVAWVVALAIGAAVYTGGMSADQMLAVDASREASAVTPLALLAALAAAGVVAFFYWRRRRSSR